MQEFRVGEALAQTFRVYFANVVSFVVIVAVVTIPSTIYDGAGAVTALTSPLYDIGSTLLSMVLGSVVSGALVYGVLQEIRGNHVNVSDCFSAGLKYVLPVIGIGFVSGIAVFVASILCLVPGLILATMWYVAVPATVVEGVGVFAALQRSSDLTSGYRWPVFGFLVVVVLIVIGVVYAVSIPFELIEGVDFSGAATGQTGILSFLGTTIAGFFVTAFAGTSSSVVYFLLRRAKEGFGVEEIASVFD